MQKLKNIFTTLETIREKVRRAKKLSSTSKREILAFFIKLQSKLSPHPPFFPLFYVI